MSKYHGTLIGSARTIATRQGTAKTGIRARLQTKSESVEVVISSDPDDGEDHLEITIRSHGSGRILKTYYDNLTRLTDLDREKDKER